ncbi:MAG: hypothetical protein ACYTEI_00375, partial [Planctomycetota bacterium]
MRKPRESRGSSTWGDLLDVLDDLLVDRLVDVGAHLAPHRDQVDGREVQVVVVGPGPAVAAGLLLGGLGRRPGGPLHVGHGVGLDGHIAIDAGDGREREPHLAPEPQGCVDQLEDHLAGVLAEDLAVQLAAVDHVQDVLGLLLVGA